MAETVFVPAGVPGAEDVTDGSVDYYDMDWINVDNGITEEEMPKCISEICGAAGRCSDNQPDQDDIDDYEIVEET